MTDSAGKFRLGNLVVNVTSGLQRCVNTKNPLCAMNYSKLCVNTCMKNMSYIPCRGGITKIECVHSPLVDFDIWTPVMLEEIPQITEVEVIAQLKADLVVAVEAATKHEEMLTAAAKPRTLEEVNVLEESLNQALKEIKTLKSQMEKK